MQMSETMLVDHGEMQKTLICHWADGDERVHKDRFVEIVSEARKPPFNSRNDDMLRVATGSEKKNFRNQSVSIHLSWVERASSRGALLQHQPIFEVEFVLVELGLDTFKVVKWE